MYAKIFSQIYDSSIAEDYRVRFVFEDMLVLADINGVVDMTPEALSRRTNVPVDIVKYAIKKLEEPDETSRCKDEDGRRIKRLDDHRDWGWFVINYQNYRDIASEEQRRAKTRARVMRFRNRKKLEKEKCNAGNAEGNDSPSSYTSPSPSSSTSNKLPTNKKRYLTTNRFA